METEAPSYVIRTYEPRDRFQVWDLHVEGLRDTGTWLPGAQFSHFNDDMRAIERTYLGQGSRFWVVAQGERLIAMVAVQRVDAATGELKRMRVTASRRRQGIAQRLLEVAEAYCREQGYQRIILETTDFQPAALALYRKNGYTEVSNRPLNFLATTARAFEKTIR